MPAILVEQVQPGLDKPWMADDHVEVGRVLGDPFLTPGQRDARMQDCHPKPRLRKKRLQPALNIVFVGELHVHPHLSSVALLSVDEV